MFAPITYLAAAVLLISTLLFGVVSVFYTPGAKERLPKQARVSNIEPGKAVASRAGDRTPPGAARMRVKDAAFAGVTPVIPAPEKPATGNLAPSAPAGTVSPAARKAPQRAPAPHRSYAAVGYDDYTAHFNRAPRGWFSEQAE